MLQRPLVIGHDRVFLTFAVILRAVVRDACHFGTRSSDNCIISQIEQKLKIFAVKL